MVVNGHVRLPVLGSAHIKKTSNSFDEGSNSMSYEHELHNRHPPAGLEYDCNVKLSPKSKAKQLILDLVYLTITSTTF